MPGIFVYGTLQLPGIVKKLTGKSFTSKPAVLPGYKRCCVKGCDYPAVIQENDAETTGLVMKNVDDRSLDIISFYEGDEYEKRNVTVFMDGEPKDVLTFVWVKGTDLLENKEWDLHAFRKKSLEHYINVLIPDTLKEFSK
jgi:gamma-glutamylcyclotransferase (GGCT)/AIG2-like uncharacterized protein YtfP